MRHYEASAEWIVERPVVSNRISTFASFGRITFTGCSTTLNGRTISITGFPHSTFALLGCINNFLDAVSDTSNGDASFTVEYRSEVAKEEKSAPIQLLHEAPVSTNYLDA